MNKLNKIFLKNYLNNQIILKSKIFLKIFNSKNLKKFFNIKNV